MFRNLRTSTKLLVLCGIFLISIGFPAYALVTEKLIAIDFARKELVGSRYLATVREIYAAVLSAALDDRPAEQRGVRTDGAVRALVEVEARTGGVLETADLARAVAATLRELGSAPAEEGRIGQPVLDALARTRALAARVGDDSNLALDPDLDTYYVQGIVVRRLPTLLGRLSELQDFFEASVAAGSPFAMRQARLTMLVGLLRSTVSEVKEDIAAAYRGNSEGSLKRAVHEDIAATIASLNSYLEVVGVSAFGVDARDTVAYSRLHEIAARQILKTWTIFQAELDRLLQQRIDNLLGRMSLGLILIGAFAGISVLVALLTHRHIVRPLEQLEAVATTVRETKDYSLRAA